MEQLSISLAQERRDTGIQRASEHAGAVWNGRARGYLLEYLANVTAPFLAEDVRDFAERRGLALPTDSRAYGAVFRKAARDGLIRKVGVAPAKSSNLSFKTLWEAV